MYDLDLPALSAAPVCRLQGPSTGEPAYDLDLPALSAAPVCRLHGPSTGEPGYDFGADPDPAMAGIAAAARAPITIAALSNVLFFMLIMTPVIFEYHSRAHPDYIIPAD